MILNKQFDFYQVLKILKNSIIIYISYHQHSQNSQACMRKRSGGIHSNSEQQFIQLADVAQQCSSLFYDEPKPNVKSKRRKYAFSVGPIDVAPVKSAQIVQKPTKIHNVFESFDFDQQSYNFSKDCEELKKAQSQINSLSHKSHFVILSNKNTQETISLLQVQLGINQQAPKSPERVINLCVHKYINEQNNIHYIDCYWIVDMSRISMYGSLVDVYTSKCEKLLDLTLPNSQSVESETYAEMSRLALKAMIEAIHYSRLEANLNKIE